MTDPYRAMCAELAGELEDWIDGYLINDPSDIHTDAAYKMIERARALLAQQEPQPPAAGEVAELVEFLQRHGSAQEAADTHWAKPMLRAADLLQRQHAQPVAVSERLPGPEDCDDEGYCWWWRTDEAEEWWDFLYLRDARDHNRRCGSARYTHWMPYHTIPNLPNPHD